MASMATAALLLLAGVLLPGEEALPGRPLRHCGSWCVDAPVVAGGIADVDGDGCADYAVLRSGRPIQAFSGADDEPIERTTEQLAEHLDPVCEWRFRAEQDLGLVRTEYYRSLFKGAPSTCAAMQDVIPFDAKGRIASQRVTGFCGRWTWLDVGSGAVRAEFELPPCAEVLFAYVARVDSDSAEDLLLICDGSAMDPNDPETECSAVIAIDAATRSELWRRELFGEATTFSFTVCGEQNLVSPGDLDGDGAADFVLAHVTHAFAQEAHASSLYALSGRTGEILWRQSSQGRFGETLGRTVALVSDRDDDGLRDLVFARGDSAGGREHVFGIVSSKSGAILKAWKP